MADPKTTEQQQTKTTALAAMSFEPSNLGEAITLSERLASSSLVHEALQKKPNDMLVILMTGRELGFAPMQSVRAVTIIEGTPTLKAEAIVALVKKNPDCLRFQLVESTDKIAVYVAHRRGEDPTRMSFTIEQAKAAQLIHQTRNGQPNNWMKWPAAMLRARCATHLARAVFPDVVLGIAEENESVERFGVAEAPPEVEVQRQVPASEAVIDIQATPRAQPVSAVTDPPRTPAPAAKGDVVDVPWETKTSEPPAVAEDLQKKIDAAKSQLELEALLPELKAAPKDQVAELRKAYGAKSAALKAAVKPPDGFSPPVPAPEANSREPGQEG